MVRAWLALGYIPVENRGVEQIAVAQIVGTDQEQYGSASTKRIGKQQQKILYTVMVIPRYLPWHPEASVKYHVLARYALRSHERHDLFSNILLGR